MAHRPSQGDFSRSGRESPLRASLWVAAGVILALAFSVAGFWRIRYLRSVALAYWEGQLSSVADVTKFAIMRWVRDRQSEIREFALLVAEQPGLFESGAGNSAATRRAAAAEGLLPYLQLIRKQNEYSAIWLTDPEGKVLLAWEKDSSPETAVRDLAAKAVIEGVWKILGPIPDSRGAPTLVFAYPVPFAGNEALSPGRKHRGAVLLTVDPSRFLFPLVSVDSVPTRTGEQMLVARLYDHFEILSPLRHQPAGGQSIRTPWEKAPEIGRVAIEQESAFGEFTDFRGVPVVAVTRHVSGTVGLIRQIDQSEAYAPYRIQARTEGLLALSILAVVALALVASQRAAPTTR